jgi:type IV pilus assembly protein PilV
MSLIKQGGFSLLEVLVTMLIITFGLLGIAGVQMLAINNTETAKYNSIATIFASNIAAQMQGNSAYWGTPPTTITVNGSTITGGPPASIVDCSANVCSASQMGYYDLAHWGLAMANGLPVGNGTIACPSGSSPAVCTITVFWSEKNIALTNPTGAASGALASGTSSTHNYQTLVSIPP